MMKKFGMIVGLIAVLMCAPAVAWAETSSVRVDAQEVPVNGNWCEYKMSEGEYVYCPIVIEDNGRLDVSVQINFEGHHYVGLLDQNYEVVRRDSVNGKGEAAPTIVNYSYYLKAGTYYVREESENGCQGKFKVKATFEKSTAEDANTNISFQTALPYTEPQVSGFLSSRGKGGSWPESLPESSQNFMDYYMLEAKTGTYDVQVTGADPDSSFECIIYDAAYQEILREYNPAYFSVDLKDGTYYFCVLSDDRIAGDYNLQINPPEEEPEPEIAIPKIEIAVGETTELTTNSSSDNISWGSTDPSVIVVSNTGTVMGLKSGTAWAAGIPTDGSPIILYQISVQ